MSRFDYSYSDETTENQALLWEANLRRAVEGKRGQKALRELEAALLAMPEKRLIEGDICRDGAVCAIGAAAAYRKVQQGKTWKQAMTELPQPPEPDEDGLIDDDENDVYATMAFAKRELAIVGVLAWRIAEVNDEWGWSGKSPEDRYRFVLGWVQKQIKAEASA